MNFLIFLIFTLHFLNFTNSSFFSNAKLHANCKKIEPTKDLDMEWAMALFGGKRFYIPMGSLSGYEDLSELLKGSKVKGPSELDEMCAEVKIKAFKSTFEAYEDKFLVLECPMIKKGVQDCKPSPRTQNPKQHQPAKGIQTLAWTDNRNSLILVRCSPDGIKNDWMLYSTQIKLKEESIKIIQNEIEKMGFNRSSFHSPLYTKCKITPDD